MQATSLPCLIAGCWSYILAVAGGMAICIDLMNQTHLDLGVTLWRQFDPTWSQSDPKST